MNILYYLYKWKKKNNRCNPNSYLDWVCSDKRIFEHNFGLIFKLSLKKDDIIDKCDEFEAKILHLERNICYEEITDYTNCYKKIYFGFFSNDYSKEYENKNVSFMDAS